ncbi:dihydroorotate dehydrogenase-like protein [Roseiconus lacunae]|uniref:dihydroorotate dehydrogenase-like protein n=1 Tax=Roseiconus lacunae TaxID=2605694 RepID=UPI003088D4FD|nr:dihydroorotate dehydrogenase-like protein [Stieleria sp. HD01]
MSGELSVDYLGLELSSPVVIGACPLTKEPETVRQLIQAGAGAIVLPSILQEQIVHRRMKTDDPLGALSHSGYQPQQDHYNGGADGYLQTIENLRKLFDVPVIASLNGSSEGQWLGFAKEIESAGAHAIEFNLQQVVYDELETSNDAEARMCDMVRQVRDQVQIPLAAKISQRYTNLESMARQLTLDDGDGAVCDGLVLFTHTPHWDVSVDRMHWTIHWELSPLHSLGAILEGVVRSRSTTPDASIAASGGVATGEDAIKAMIAGADVVMVTSVVYRHGPDAIRDMVDGIRRHVEWSHHPTLREFLAARLVEPVNEERFMRMEYVDPLTRSETYFDPTPEVSPQSGDAYGHQF